ncbi:fosfomycin resistance protein AbaF [Comamonadaceae bacterium OS-1]|nr:fosfomycin resistance protein AbaF [Comamonadaceae bacterium OS-1]
MTFTEPELRPHGPARAPAKAAWAAWVGSALEYYDFFLYGTAAALVFGPVFFPMVDSRLQHVAAFATFGMGYVARPLGAVVLGHLGDRHGRKPVLSLTLVLMGASTFLIGLLPGHAQIGMAAPVLLVVLRLLQGFSVAAEHAGANAMTLEHAPAHRRGFYASLSLSGTAFGFVLASLVFLPVAALPQADMLAWGWRIPFLLSVVVVLAGLWVRRAVPESPVFAVERARFQDAPLPILDLFRCHRVAVLRVALAALVTVVSTVSGVFLLAYAVNTMGMPRQDMLVLMLLGSVLALFAAPAWAWLADRVGRRPVFIAGALGSAALTWPLLWAVSQAEMQAVFWLGLLLTGVAYSAANGIAPALYGEMFDTRVRLSGMAIGTQIGVALSGFAPSVCAALIAEGPHAWPWVAGLVTLVCTVAAGAVFTAPETRNVPTQLLGRRSGTVASLP